MTRHYVIGGIGMQTLEAIKRSLLQAGVTEMSVKLSRGGMFSALYSVDGIVQKDQFDKILTEEIKSITKPV